MDPELIQYYNDLDDMFGMKGWLQLLENAKAEIYDLQATALEAASYEEIMFMKGQAEVLNRIINLRDITSATRAHHEADAEADAEDNAAV